VAGPNDNFAPAFTVPASMTLLGYTRDRDKPAGTKRYRTVRVKVNTAFATAKGDAVIAAIQATLAGTRARLFQSGYGAGGSYSRIDIEYGNRASLSSWTATAPATAAQVTSALAAAVTAMA
jgi:hypothetical protein